MPAPRDLLLKMFEAAVSAVDPLIAVPPNLPPVPVGRTIVIGAGKGAARMALAVERSWKGPVSGLVVTRYGHGEKCERIEVVEAAHPVPDEAGQKAAHRMLDMVQGLSSDDLVICLMSGGASALLSCPAHGISLEEKRTINRALLKSGAGITEMNCVRKHLSAIKGGRLALACHPARVVTLVVSDVPGDDPAIVGSGPTIASASTAQDALAILKRYRIPVSDQTRNAMLENESLAPAVGDPRLQANETVVIATAQQALDAAAAVASAAGYQPMILGNNIEGEAREVARVHAAIAKQVVLQSQPLKVPCILLSGGETTVTVRGSGRGGRNAEFLLALAVALEGSQKIHAIACDTDGIDGTEDNAGCILAPDTVDRALARDIDAGAYLENNDGYSFFTAVDSLVITGPTRTNVNDFRAILIEA